MLGAAVLSLIVLASLALSLWSWRKLHVLEQRAEGKAVVPAGRLALYSAVPVLVTGVILTWRHSLAGWPAIEFLIAYIAVAYPLLLWIGYLLMRIARGTSD